MKAAVFTGIETFQIRDLPIPRVEEDGMLVKVMACGLCGSDIRNFHIGLRADVKEQVIGHEIAGVVEETGIAVTAFKKGDRVAIAPDVSCGTCYYCARGLVNLCNAHRMVGTHWPGGFAQYIYLPRIILERGMVNKLCGNLGFYEATLAEPLSSVLAAQERANVQLGDTVVVIGDGPIGCMHLEVAKARGASKTIMAGLTRLESAEQFHPDYLINSGEEDPVQRVMELTEGLGADVIITANPVAKTQAQAVQMAKKRGRVLLFGGIPRANPEAMIDTNKVHYEEIMVMGAFSYNLATNRKAIQALTDGVITANKYVTMSVPLEGIMEGIAAAEAGKALKVVIDPWK